MLTPRDIGSGSVAVAACDMTARDLDGEDEGVHALPHSGPDRHRGEPATHSSCSPIGVTSSVTDPRTDDQLLTQLPRRWTGSTHSPPGNMLGPRDVGCTPPVLETVRDAAGQSGVEPLGQARRSNDEVVARGVVADGRHNIR